jgi:hypothetical protein
LQKSLKTAQSPFTIRTRAFFIALNYFSILCSTNRRECKRAKKLLQTLALFILSFSSHLIKNHKIETKQCKWDGLVGMRSGGKMVAANDITRWGRLRTAASAKQFSKCSSAFTAHKIPSLSQLISIFPCQETKKVLRAHKWRN